MKCGNKYCKETWDIHTNNRILKLHPTIQCSVKRFINEVEETYNMKIRITDAYRTYTEQDELYKQGRSKAGKIITNAKGGYSYHNFGLAIDVVEVKDKKANYDVSVTKKIAPIAKKHGLAWGGDWKSFKDYPHFDMTFNKTTEELRKLVKEYGDYKKIPLE